MVADANALAMGCTQTGARLGRGVQGQCGEAPSLDTPLHMATARGNVTFVQALVKADPSAAVSPNVKVAPSAPAPGRPRFTTWSRAAN